jgi:hypothetical protein
MEAESFSADANETIKVIIESMPIGNPDFITILSVKWITNQLRLSDNLPLMAKATIYGVYDCE